MKILLFCDSYKDDLYSLSILVAQCYFNSVEIVGIICDDGFLSYPQNVSIVQYWLEILQFQDIDIFRGVERETYLKQQNIFPESYVTSYINTMNRIFGYNPTVNPKYLTLDHLLIKIKKYHDKSISILTTGNLTTLSHLISTNTDFENKIKIIYSMIGNQYVDGNVVSVPREYVVANAEYNASLDPDSFSNIVNRHHMRLHIIPLDCTVFAPLTYDTLNRLTAIGSKYYNDTQNNFVKNIYTQIITLLNETLIDHNTKLYMWDIVATMLFLQKSINQKYITPNINNCNQPANKCVLFNHIDYQMLLYAVIDSIFVPISRKLESTWEFDFHPDDLMYRHFC